MSLLKNSISLSIGIVLLTFIGQKAAAFGHGSKEHASKEKYSEGYYYDKQGHKMTGLISKDDLEFESFYFKKQLGDSAVKVGAEECDSFSVDHRVFHTITDVSLKAIVWGTHLDKAFAELMNDGAVQLYCIRFEPAKVGYMKYVSIASNFTGGEAGQVVGAMAGRRNVNYYVRRQNAGDYTLVQKKTFKDQLSDYLKDDQPVAQKIMQNPDYTLNNIAPIIREYNQDKDLEFVADVQRNK